MVMREGPPRQAYVLARGNYEARGEPAGPGLPDAVAAGRASAANRLELARWIASRSNPLTARVIVNRFWQMLFGVGIVKTVDDFGSQGEAPSNQDLLDWLAVEFMDSGWDIKRLFKTIMTSAAYQQSSRVDNTLGERDPGQQTARSRSPLPPVGGHDPRPSARGIGLAGGDSGRAVGQAIPTFGTVERGFRLDLRSRIGTGSVPTQHLHLLEAHGRASVNDEFRRVRPRSLHGACQAHQHSAAGAQSDERPDIRRGLPQARGERSARGCFEFRGTHRRHVPQGAFETSPALGDRGAREVARNLSGRVPRGSGGCARTARCRRFALDRGRPTPRNWRPTLVSPVSSSTSTRRSRSNESRSQASRNRYTAPFLRQGRDRGRIAGLGAHARKRPVAGSGIQPGRRRVGGPAAFRAESQASHLALPIGRPIAAGDFRPEARPGPDARPGTA